MQFWLGGNDSDTLRDVLLTDMVVRQSQDFNDCVNVPFLCRSILLTDLTNLVGQLLFELSISKEEVI